MITAERWYDQQPDLALYYQGDVVRDIPFPTFPPTLPSNREEAWPILRPIELKSRTVEQAMSQLPNKLVGRTPRDVPDVWTLSYGEWVAANVKNQHVMIVSRACSLDNPKRKHCLTAPVTSVAALPQAERAEEKLRALRNNEIPHLFYLPEKDDLPESYADLLMLTPIHRSFFTTEKIPTHRVAKLSGHGTTALQLVISNHFGIQFGFDHEDICPLSGSYRCINCFHLGIDVTLRQKTATQAFGVCQGCGDEACWVHMQN